MKAQSKILIIDDDRDYVETMKNILEKIPYTVETAFSKKEGWDKIRTFQPNLILLDIMLETMTDGFWLSQEIRKHPDFHQIPILCISSINQVTHLHFSPETDGKAFPVDDFIEKPVQPDDLINHIETLLHKHTALIEADNESLL